MMGVLGAMTEIITSVYRFSRTIKLVASSTFHRRDSSRAWPVSWPKEKRIWQAVGSCHDLVVHLHRKGRFKNVPSKNHIFLCTRDDKDAIESMIEKPDEIYEL